MIQKGINCQALGEYEGSTPSLSVNRNISSPYCINYKACNLPPLYVTDRSWQWLNYQTINLSKICRDWTIFTEEMSVKNFSVSTNFAEIIKL